MSVCDYSCVCDACQGVCFCHWLFLCPLALLSSDLPPVLLLIIVLL